MTSQDSAVPNDIPGREPRAEMRWPNAVTLVLVAETPLQRRWAASAALALSRELAGQRRKVVVADIKLPDGILGEALGIRNGRGIVDVLFRGVAFSKAARRPESESFYFLPPGTDAPPADVVYRHPQWEKIAARFAEADAFLILCAAAPDWRASGPIPGFEATVVINAVGGPVDLPSGALRRSEFVAPQEVRAQQRRPTVSAESEVGVRGGSEDGDEDRSQDAVEARSQRPVPTPEARDAHAAVPAEQRSGRAAAPGEPGVGDDAVASTAGRALFGRRRSRAPRRGFLVATAAAAVVALLSWGGIRFARFSTDSEALEATERTPKLRAAAETVVADPAPHERTDAVVADDRPLGFSVLIASYSSFEDAVRRERRLTRSDLPYYVAPTVVRGVVYYRVFAGVLADRDEAAELMAELVAEGVKDTARNWDIRPARLSFDFGTFDDRKSATDVIESLLDHGIPAYAVPVAGGRGSDEPRYRVYSGGYEEREDARPLREQIERAGFDARLTERSGLESR